MHLTQVPRWYDQRSVLVFDQECHDLNHGRFDGRQQLKWQVPVDGSFRVPLRSGGLSVKLAGCGGPELVTVAQTETKDWTASLHGGTARGQAPGGLCGGCGQLASGQLGVARGHLDTA